MMADTPVDYHGILEAAQFILQGDATLADAAILVEEEFGFGLGDKAKAVYIYSLSRNATEAQPIAAGKRTRFNLSLLFWCVGFNMGSIREAARLRDALIGRVESVLMNNRTLNGKVDTAWLGGGDFLSAKNPESQSFLSAGEITMVCEVKAINE
jgi:hypothetical protein